MTLFPPSDFVSVFLTMPVVVDHSRYNNDDYRPPNRMESDLFLSLELPHVTIQMPHSRITRSRYESSPPNKPWPKLIAETYNKNSVGSFAGNFDKPLTSNIRCGNTILTFKEFVEYRHSTKYDCEHFEVDMEEYNTLDDVNKIKSLRVSDKGYENLKISGPSSIRGKSGELDKIVYTCTKHNCVLPCVCYLCNDENPDECAHTILHPGFFDPKTHLFTVRNADSFDMNWNEDHLTYGNTYCTNRKCRGCVVRHCPPERRFNYRLSCIDKDKMFCLCVDCPYCKSLDVLKYAGTEKSCSSCQMKLLHHESYHLVYHYMCIFCRESLLKFKNITSEKEYWENFDEMRFEETISCQYCFRMFFDKQKKERHIEIVHKKNPDYLFGCEACERSFGSKQALNYHIESFHGKVNLEIPCTICEKSFKMDHNLDEHMRAVHSDLTFNCELCLSEFKRQSNLNHHYKIKHDTYINKLFLNNDPSIVEFFECEFCKKKYREKRTLVHHIKIVHNKEEQPVLACNECKFTTIEMKTLNHHKKTIHTPEQLERYNCELCSFTTTQKKTLNRHIQSLHRNDRYECDHCDFVTRRKDTLDVHKKKAHAKSIELFYCDDCDFVSKFKKNLTKHRKKFHTAKESRKDFKCDECEFRTIEKAVILEHIKLIHIECDRCPFKTILQEVMNIHKSSVHPRQLRKRKAQDAII